MKTYYFKQHDEGGRAIKINCWKANSFEEADEMEYQNLLKNPDSHGNTYCDCKGNELPIPRDEADKMFEIHMKRGYASGALIHPKR